MKTKWCVLAVLLIALLLSCRIAHAIPVVYGGDPFGHVAAGTTSVNVTVKTDVNSTCKIGSSPNIVYASMATTMSTTGAKAHSHSVGSLTNGTTTARYIRCTDGSPTTRDYTVTWTVNTTTVRYISPTGSGSSCTTESPCSFSTANSASVRGDTVIFKAGEYAPVSGSGTQPNQAGVLYRGEFPYKTGPASIIKHTGTSFCSSCYVLRVRADDITIRDLILDGNTAAQNICNIQGTQTIPINGVTWEKTLCRNGGTAGFFVHGAQDATGRKRTVVRFNRIEHMGYGPDVAARGELFYLCSASDMTWECEDIEIYGNFGTDYTDNFIDHKSSAHHVLSHHNIAEKHISGNLANPLRTDGGDGATIRSECNSSHPTCPRTDSENLSFSNIFRTLIHENTAVVKIEDNRVDLKTNVFIDFPQNLVVSGGGANGPWIKSSSNGANSVITANTLCNSVSTTSGTGFTVSGNFLNQAQSVCDAEVARITGEQPELVGGVLAPSIVFARVLDTAKNVVSIKFDQAIFPNTSNAITGWTCKKDATAPPTTNWPITDATASPSTFITLTMTGDAAFGDDITCNYNPGTGNALNSSGTEIQTVADRIIENLVAVTPVVFVSGECGRFGDNICDLHFFAGANVPMLPATACSGFSARKGATGIPLAWAISNCNRLDNDTFRLTMATNLVQSEDADFSYNSVAVGSNVTDSLSTEVTSFTNQLVTNLVVSPPLTYISSVVEDATPTILRVAVDPHGHGPLIIGTSCPGFVATKGPAGCASQVAWPTNSCAITDGTHLALTQATAATNGQCIILTYTPQGENALAVTNSVPMELEGFDTATTAYADVVNNVGAAPTAPVLTLHQWQAFEVGQPETRMIYAAGAVVRMKPCGQIVTRAAVGVTAAAYSGLSWIWKYDADNNWAAGSAQITGATTPLAFGFDVQRPSGTTLTNQMALGGRTFVSGAKHEDSVTNGFTLTSVATGSQIEPQAILRADCAASPGSHAYVRLYQGNGVAFDTPLTLDILFEAAQGVQ